MAPSVSKSQHAAITGARTNSCPEMPKVVSVSSSASIRGHAPVRLTLSCLLSGRQTGHVVTMPQYLHTEVGILLSNTPASSLLFTPSSVKTFCHQSHLYSFLTFPLLFFFSVFRSLQVTLIFPFFVLPTWRRPTLCQSCKQLQWHTVYTGTTSTRSDRLLSAVVDRMQVKLQQQMEKHSREACRAASHAPCLCAAAAYIWQCIKGRGSHSSSAQTHPWQTGPGGS